LNRQGDPARILRPSRPFIKSHIIKAAWPFQTPSFPGLTGESRKTLDARFKPAGMTPKPLGKTTICQFDKETFNKNIVLYFLSERWFQSRG